MATTRAKQLEALAMRIPAANQRAAQGAEAARQIQLQETIKGATPQVAAAGPQVGQQLAAQQVTAAAEPQLAARAQTQTQMTTFGGDVGVSEASRESRRRTANKELQLTQRQREAAGKLARFGRDVDRKILDQQLQFKVDEAGRELLNTRQLMDFAALQARNEEDYRDKQQLAEQTYSRLQQEKRMAIQVIEQTLQNDRLLREQKLSNQQTEKLYKLKRDLERKMQKDQAKARNKMAMWQAGGQVVGAGILMGATLLTGGTAAAALPYLAPAMAGGQGIATYAASNDLDEYLNLD